MSTGGGGGGGDFKVGNIRTVSTSEGKFRRHVVATGMQVKHLLTHLIQQLYPNPCNCPTQSSYRGNMGLSPLGDGERTGMRFWQGACPGTSPLEVEPSLHLGSTPAQNMGRGLPLPHPPDPPNNYANTMQ